MKPGVLIVEDDSKTAELIRLYLDRDGYPVTVARNGREWRGAAGAIGA